MSWSAVAALAAIGAFYTFFYTRVVARAGLVADAVVSRTDLLEHHPRREVDQLAKLAMAAAAQTAFVVVLVAVVPRVAVLDLVGGASPSAWLLAAPLGVAELGLSVLLCTALVETVPDPRRLLAASRAGWIAQFTSARRILPGWAFVVLAGLYVAVEELVFRGVVIDLTRPLGMPIAVAASVLLFGWAQLAGMPRRADAVFAIIGAVVIGTVHGSLFWFTDDVGPLMLAHLVFLIGAFTQLRQPVQAASW